LSQFTKNYSFFANKIVSKLSKIWVGDPVSEIEEKPLPDPGSRGKKGTGSQIRIHNTDFRKVRRSSNVTGKKVICTRRY
jgi:hypothetical protein